MESSLDYVTDRWHTLEHNQAAYFPVVLSPIKLHLRSLWYIAAGGRQPNLILWGPRDDQTRVQG